jgi:hypothetical protein
MQIAYFTKATKTQGAFLTITTLGQPFTNGERQPVGGKRDARKLCEALGVKPWNF